ncbi:MAG: membrane protein insertion efficiency factor YidD [Bdellovibrionaceae bacterium]|nr:membrane protein insertion efficiency factor YidD [Pseudobdellovibrionaceae bacterium]
MKALKNGSSKLLIILIGVYRTVGTTHLGGACRFTPSCSEYALDVARSQTFFAAIKFILIRILKCRPGGSYGLDPAPPAQGDANARSK